MLQILEYPSATLAMRSEDVTNFDVELKQITDDLIKFMYENNGVGIAAPQLGILKRIAVVDIVNGKRDKQNAKILINPQLTWSSKETNIAKEGCLSIPGKMCDVERANSVEVTYQELSGQSRTFVFNGFAARVIQHELDHLNGILMVDRAVA